ncbi:predicted protein [Postia placenta Mad-698-R]|nr:predicted protein [Postia placenta Mad-698-R]
MDELTDYQRELMPAAHDRLDEVMDEPSRWTAELALLKQATDGHLRLLDDSRAGTSPMTPADSAREPVVDLPPFREMLRHARPTDFWDTATPSTSSNEAHTEYEDNDAVDELATMTGDRRQAPLGPDTPLFGSRIPPGTSTQSHNSSISPSTLFDTFDVTRSQAREAASCSAGENLNSSSRTHSTPSPTIPGNFDRDEEDEIDQELQDDFDEEPIPSTAEERTSSPELLGLTTSNYDTSTPDLFERSGSSPEPEDPFPSTSNLVLPTPSSVRAHAQPPIASSSRLSVIPTSDLAPPPPLAPSNAASNSNLAPPAPTIPSTTTTSSSSPAPTTTTNMSQTTNTPLMPPHGHSTAPSFDPSEVRSLRRYFQDLEALFTRVGTCEFAEIDIRDGKCKRNTEGKIVLPNGSFCPRTIPGLTIRDRIYEWHRRNPAAPAAPTMLFEIDDRSTVQTFTLNTSSRIEALERELLQLRKRREVFDGVEILQRKKPTMPVVTRNAEASRSGTSKGVAAPSSTSTSTAPPPTIPAASPAPSSSQPTQSTSQPITTSAPPAPPVHPFANARDATYAPPNVRNFATPPKPSNDKGKEPAYKTIVPVIQPKLAEEIFQRSMKSQFVTLTPEELLSIAPDVRTKYRDTVTPKRVSTEPVASAHIVEIGADQVTAVNQLSCSGATLEPGATIVPDPYETYLKHIPHGEHPAEFTIARDSNAIRSIIALIDNKEQIECIVDPGSQIVAMSEEVCLGLNLLFDPTIQLNMQSANGEVDRSLGLI